MVAPSARKLLTFRQNCGVEIEQRDALRSPYASGGNVYLQRAQSGRDNSDVAGRNYMWRLFGTVIPEKYDGEDMGWLAAMIVTEEIARVSSSLRVQVNMQVLGCAYTIFRYGTEEVKKKLKFIFVETVDEALDAALEKRRASPKKDSSKGEAGS